MAQSPRDRRRPDRVCFYDGRLALFLHVHDLYAEISGQHDPYGCEYRQRHHDCGADSSLSPHMHWPANEKRPSLQGATSLTPNRSNSTGWSRHCGASRVAQMMLHFGANYGGIPTATLVCTQELRPPRNVFYAPRNQTTTAAFNAILEMGVAMIRTHRGNPFRG